MLDFRYLDDTIEKTVHAFNAKNFRRNNQSLTLSKSDFNSPGQRVEAEPLKTYRFAALSLVLKQADPGDEPDIFEAFGISRLDIRHVKLELSRLSKDQQFQEASSEIENTAALKVSDPGIKINKRTDDAAENTAPKPVQQPAEKPSMANVPHDNALPASKIAAAAPAKKKSLPKKTFPYLDSTIEKTIHVFNAKDFRHGDQSLSLSIEDFKNPGKRVEAEPFKTYRLAALWLALNQANRWDRPKIFQNFGIKHGRARPVARELRRLLNDPDFQNTIEEIDNTDIAKPSGLPLKVKTNGANLHAPTFGSVDVQKPFLVPIKGDPLPVRKITAAALAAYNDVKHTDHSFKQVVTNPRISFTDAKRFLAYCLYKLRPKLSLSITNVMNLKKPSSAVADISNDIQSRDKETIEMLRLTSNALNLNQQQTELLFTPGLGRFRNWTDVLTGPKDRLERLPAPVEDVTLYAVYEAVQFSLQKNRAALQNEANRRADNHTPDRLAEMVSEYVARKILPLSQLSDDELVSKTGKSSRTLKDEQLLIARKIVSGDTSTWLLLRDAVEKLPVSKKQVEFLLGKNLNAKFTYWSELREVPHQPVQPIARASAQSPAGP